MYTQNCICVVPVPFDYGLRPPLRTNGVRLLHLPPTAASETGMEARICLPCGRRHRATGEKFYASAAFTRALARAGSMALAWRSFTVAITRPMSFIEEAPSSAMMA